MDKKVPDYNYPDSFLPEGSDLREVQNDFVAQTVENGKDTGIKRQESQHTPTRTIAERIAERNGTNLSGEEPAKEPRDDDGWGKGYQGNETEQQEAENQQEPV